MKNRLILCAVAVFGILISCEGRAEDALSKIDALSQKIDAVASKQDQILQALSDVKSELEIVKIRASLKN